MSERIQWVFFDFRCPLCRLSKENQRKNTVFLGVLVHYFPYSSGTFLAPVWLCARERLCSAVSGFPAAVRWEIGVHRCGAPCCSLLPVCSCGVFFSHSLPASPPTCWWLISVRILEERNCCYQQCNSWLLRNYCWCSFLSIAGVYGETWSEKKLVSSLCLFRIFS